MSGMVERVARALAIEDRLDPDEDPNYVNGKIKTEVAYPPEARLWWRYRRKARAAIEAMYEPTEEMRAAIEKHLNDPAFCSADGVWYCGIDAALTKPEK